MPLTLRQFVRTTLVLSPELRALGLPEKAVVQADTADSVESRPFIVIRWGEERAGMGSYTFRPFDLWVYDTTGDYTRADNVGRKAVDILKQFEQQEVEGGWLMRIEGGMRGPDARDDGYKCLVAPYRLTAVASGV